MYSRCKVSANFYMTESAVKRLQRCFGGQSIVFHLFYRFWSEWWRMAWCSFPGQREFCHADHWWGRSISSENHLACPDHNRKHVPLWRQVQKFTEPKTEYHENRSSDLLTLPGALATDLQRPLNLCLLRDQH